MGKTCVLGPLSLKICHIPRENAKATPKAWDGLHPSCERIWATAVTEVQSVWLQEKGRARAHSDDGSVMGTFSFRPWSWIISRNM